MAALLSLLIRILAIGGLGTLTAVGVYTALPEEVKIAVPFTSQAPHGVWTEPWQNACEEASIVMINNFYQGSTLDKEKAQDEILNIFNIKEDQVGPSFDESMETVASIINNSKLSWSAKVINDPTIEEIKTELFNRRPIIAPIYAPSIENPYYVDGGPDYHVVVLTGYDDKTQEFIFHDPGTSKGEDYRYSYEGFYEAISDFLEDSDYRSGPTRVIYTSLRN